MLCKTSRASSTTGFNWFNFLLVFLYVFSMCNLFHAFYVKYIKVSRTLLYIQINVLLLQPCVQVPKQHNCCEPLGRGNPQHNCCHDIHCHDTCCHDDSASLARELPAAVAAVITVCVTINVIYVSPWRLWGQWVFGQWRLCSVPQLDWSSDQYQ